MPKLTAIRREWKTLLSIGFFLMLMLIFARQLYLAWVYGTARLFWDLISYDTDPIGFGVVYGIGFVLSAAIAIPSIIVWPAELRFFQRRASRPPLDNAIRGSQDPRA